MFWRERAQYQDQNLSVDAYISITDRFAAFIYSGLVILLLDLLRSALRQMILLAFIYSGLTCFRELVYEETKGQGEAVNCEEREQVHVGHGMARGYISFTCLQQSTIVFPITVP
ncbi:hypothetical protein L2E82_10709 [Cichorium intybus]|uniref:Uncharacterized protein n=1 Tax=Cichorium intybus TaxID=13427 RepID=A0ACB9GCB9_CICIN|nr:hypothetical protein L2E82_10709 [Cichorium intybus]